MTIYNFHIFDGSGNCLFSLQPNDKSNEILYGFLYSLKSFIQRISPSINQDNNYFYYQTINYNLIFYEFVTSIKFVLIIQNDQYNNNNKRDSQFYRELMLQLHRNIYLEYHIKNGMAKLSTQKTVTKSIEKIDSQLFRQQLEQFLRQNIK